MAEAARQLDTIDVAPAFTAADAAAMQIRFAGMPAPEMLRELLTGELAGRIASVSSYGAESAVLLHMVAQIDKDVPVIFTNTQKMFGEDPRAGRWRGWDKVECGIHVSTLPGEDPAF